MVQDRCNAIEQSRRTLTDVRTIGAESHIQLDIGVEPMVGLHRDYVGTNPPRLPHNRVAVVIPSRLAG